jgi:hypothetical protein
MSIDVGEYAMSLPIPNSQGSGELYSWLSSHLNPQVSVPTKATVRTLDVVAEDEHWIKVGDSCV